MDADVISKCNWQTYRHIQYNIQLYCVCIYIYIIFIDLHISVTRTPNMTQYLQSFSLSLMYTDRRQCASGCCFRSIGVQRTGRTRDIAVHYHRTTNIFTYSRNVGVFFVYHQTPRQGDVMRPLWLRLCVGVTGCVCVCDRITAVNRWPSMNLRWINRL